MKILETPISGSWLLEMETIPDNRGFFARGFCADQFASNGLKFQIKQQSISFNVKRGTLRGMHFQKHPHQEVKLVRVTRGRIYDVILDLRRDSPSYLKWYSVELSAENRMTLYVPEGVAHGFQTLDDNTEVFYQMTHSYIPESSSGVRWNDHSFNITWPISSAILSSRDANYPDFLHQSKHVNEK